MRSDEEINAIKASISGWESFFLRYGKPGDLFQGPPKLASESDQSLYRIIEQSWFTILSGDELPQDLALTQRWIKEMGPLRSSQRDLQIC